MLSCFYIDNAHYQENIIPKINKKNGHEVLIIASTDVFVKNNVLGTTNSSTYINEDGIKVIRIPYLNFLSNYVAMKIRAYKGIYKIIEDFAPDIILFHGAAAYALNDVGRYIKKNPLTKLFVDSHEDFNNSARGFVSKYILHLLFYKKILLNNLKYIDKILYITKETHNYLKELYDVPEEKLGFFPLGGIIPEEELRNNTRNKIRKKLNVSENDFLCIHSGKFDKLKRTEDILKGFSECKSKKNKLIIVGVINETFEATLKEFLKDDRIQFLGWKKADELQEYLMASDLYIQLGSQSATMQQSICNGCVVAVYPFESHTFLLKDACYYITNEVELTNILNKIDSDDSDFREKVKKSKHIAKDLLNYEVISNVIFN